MFFILFIYYLKYLFLLYLLGLAMEDYVIHQERELRRCYLFETILRQRYEKIKK